MSDVAPTNAPPPGATLAAVSAGRTSGAPPDAAGAAARVGPAASPGDPGSPPASGEDGQTVLPDGQVLTTPTLPNVVTAGQLLKFFVPVPMATNGPAWVAPGVAFSPPLLSLPTAGGAPASRATYTTPSP